MSTPWDKLSMKERQQLMHVYVKNGITELGTMQNHYNKFAGGGGIDIGEVQSSTDKDTYIQEVIKWTIDHPGGLWADNERAAAARKWLSVNAPEELSALYWNESDEIRKGIDRRFIPSDAKEKGMEMSVGDAMNDFGNKIYNVVDTATAFVPGPVGTLNWLAHMGANGMQSKWGNVVLDLGMAGAMHGIGKGLKALNETDAVKNIKDKFTTAFINAHPNSKLALKINYSNLDIDNSIEKPYRITSLGNNRFKITGFDVDYYHNTAKKLGDKTINVPSNIPEDVAEKYVKKLAAQKARNFRINESLIPQQNFATTIHEINKAIYEQSKQLRALGYDKETLSHMMAESKKIPFKFENFDFNADTLASLLAESSYRGSRIPDTMMLDYKKFPKVYRDIIHKWNTKLTHQGFDSYSYLKEILRESPQYSERANLLLRQGLSEENVVKQLLQDRFTFTRGLGVDEVPAKESQLFTVPKTSTGGRVDIEVFPDLDFVNEDALYTSNSLPTAFAYSYPSKAKYSRVGIWYRDPASFDLTGTPLEWWQNPNNRLPSDIVKVAPSTVNNSASKIAELRKLYFGTSRHRYTENSDRAGFMIPVIASHLNVEKGMHHYLFRGKRGSEMPLPNMKLKIFDTTGKTAEDLPSIFGNFISESDIENIKNSITRNHYGVWTPGFSLGNALGGPLKKVIKKK